MAGISSPQNGLSFVETRSQEKLLRKVLSRKISRSQSYSQTHQASPPPNPSKSPTPNIPKPPTSPNTISLPCKPPIFQVRQKVSSGVMPKSLVTGNLSEPGKPKFENFLLFNLFPPTSEGFMGSQPQPIKASGGLTASRAGTPGGSGGGVPEVPEPCYGKGLLKGC